MAVDTDDMGPISSIVLCAEDYETIRRTSKPVPPPGVSFGVWHCGRAVAVLSGPMPKGRASVCYTDGRTEVYDISTQLARSTTPATTGSTEAHVGDDNTIDITTRIEAKSERKGPPFGLHKRGEHEKHRHCTHPRTTVDFEARTIECRKCEALLDPWQVLKTLVEAFESGWKSKRWARTLAVERSRLTDDVKELKRERSHVRAALKREGVRLGKLRREQAIKGGDVTEIAP